MSKNHTNAPSQRRLVLKTLGGSAVAGGLADKLPGVWQRPLIGSAVLPAHAQASYVPSLLFRLERGGEEEFPLILPYTPRVSGDSLTGITLYPTGTAGRPTARAGRLQVLDAFIPAAHAQNDGDNSDTFLSVQEDNGRLIPAGATIVIRVGEIDSATNLPRHTCNYPIRVFPGPANHAPLVVGGEGPLDSVDVDDLRAFDASGRPLDSTPANLPRQGMRCGTFMIYPGQWADGGGFINGYRRDEEAVPGTGPVTYTWRWQPTGPDPSNPSATLQYMVEGSFTTLAAGFIGPDHVMGHVYRVSVSDELLYTVDLSAGTLTLAGEAPVSRAFNHEFRFNTEAGRYFREMAGETIHVDFRSAGDPPFYGIQYSGSTNSWSLHNGGANPMNLLTGINGLAQGPVFQNATEPPAPAQTTAAPGGPPPAQTTAAPVAPPAGQTTTTAPATSTTEGVPTPSVPPSAPTTTGTIPAGERWYEWTLGSATNPVSGTAAGFTDNNYYVIGEFRTMSPDATLTKDNTYFHKYEVYENGSLLYTLDLEDGTHGSVTLASGGGAMAAGGSTYNFMYDTSGSAFAASIDLSVVVSALGRAGIGLTILGGLSLTNAASTGVIFTASFTPPVIRQKMSPADGGVSDMIAPHPITLAFVQPATQPSIAEGETVIIRVTRTPGAYDVVFDMQQTSGATGLTRRFGSAPVTFENLPAGATVTVVQFQHPRLDNIRIPSTDTYVDLTLRAHTDSDTETDELLTFTIFAADAKSVSPGTNTEAGPGILIGGSTSGNDAFRFTLTDPAPTTTPAATTT